MKTKLVKDLQPYLAPTTVREDEPILQMVKKLVEQKFYHPLCIVDKSGVLKGVIDKKRIFQAIFSHHVPPSSMVSRLYALITSETASDLLIKHVITIQETDTLDQLITTMIEHDLIFIPVVDKQGRLKGMVSIDMLLEEWLKMHL